MISEEERENALKHLRYYGNYHAVLPLGVRQDSEQGRHYSDARRAVETLQKVLEAQSKIR